MLDDVKHQNRIVWRIQLAHHPTQVADVRTQSSLTPSEFRRFARHFYALDLPPS
jgi:hypothetical protein